MLSSLTATGRFETKSVLSSLTATGRVETVVCVVKFDNYWAI